MSNTIKTESLGNVHSSVDTNKTGWRRIFAFIGPAYLVSVGYMDPGNWATDLAAGSQFGYRLIWVLLLSNLIALLLQTLSVRLGIVRGLDIAQVSKNSYPPFVNMCLYILAQISIIACDLAEVIGMAIGLELLFGLPLIWGVSITMLDTLVLLFLLNKGMRKLEAFIVGLIFIVGLSFIIQLFIVQPNGTEMLKGFIPHTMSHAELYIAIGIIGATVMPHNLYLHSSLVQTRKIERTDEGIRNAIKFNLWDTSIALNLAFFVNAAILVLAASAFFKHGYHQVAEIQDAHKLLQSLFGSLAPKLFALALIASGQSSTITGTLAGQIIMEGHLNLRIAPWLRRLLTRVLAIVPAFFTILHAGNDGLGKLLILSQVVLSLQLGFAVVPLIHFTSDKKRMGKFAISKWMALLSWLFAALIIGLNAKLVVDQLNEWSTGNKAIIHYLFSPIAAAIALLLLYVFLRPLIFKYNDKPAYIPHGLATALSKMDAVVYKHIGITIDFSRNDHESIRHAIMQGGKHARYTLIHVVETAGAQYHGRDTMDHETQSDINNLDKYVDEIITLGYHAAPQIGFGFPADAISEIVKKEGIDFLVMGSHGHKVIKDLIYGSTVDKVRHNVNIPVLIVKPSK